MINIEYIKNILIKENNLRRTRGSGNDRYLKSTLQQVRGGLKSLDYCLHLKHVNECGKSRRGQKADGKGRRESKCRLQHGYLSVHYLEFRMKHFVELTLNEPKLCCKLEFSVHFTLNL